MNKSNDLLVPAPTDFKWPRCPEAEFFLQGRIQEFLSHHPFAKNLSERMMKETSTEFMVWVDHLLLPLKNSEETLKKLGFVVDKKCSTPTGVIPYHYPFADLPKVLVSKEFPNISCAIQVENIWEFQLAFTFSHAIEGTPLSGYRVMRVPGPTSELLIVERRGVRGYIPTTTMVANDYLNAFEMWANRPRVYQDATAGLDETHQLAQTLVRHLGEGLAAWIFLDAERHFWQRRNKAARIQKLRQDSLGLGWANHDHHTFRSSRPQFPGLIEILKTFGFKKRERFYAGAEAGWGAQIMEQPEANLVIFADVDLTPDDAHVDFSTQALPELDKPGTVGLWCALHGESILKAGLHHLEAQFHFDHLRAALKEDHIEIMAPFSDFSFLRQAFTKGEPWMVEASRLKQLMAQKKISKEAFEKIKKEGAVGSHLENLQRREGFKGFNQHGVSDIITEVNPERQALK